MNDNNDLMQSNPRTNVAAVIIRDGQLLLTENSNPDGSGVHYNFPGGGVALNETLYDAVRREAWEEARAKVRVGKLLAVWEYLPPNNERFGDVHKIGHLFACDLLPHSEPANPDEPDYLQVGIRWVALDRLHTIQLYPDLGDDLLPVIQGELHDSFYGTLR